MYDIPLDFSALSNLYCGRRYQFSCVRGMNSGSADTDFGNAAHEFFEKRNKGDATPLHTLMPQIISKWKITTITPLMLIGMQFDNMKQPPPITDTANTPAAEYKFSIPFATAGNYRIVLCGTMDLLYSYQDKFLVIRDYKTTKALGTAAENIVAGYTSSLQLPFYAYALYRYLYAFLPQPYADLALNLNITGEFQMIYASAPMPKFDLTPRISITQHTINTVERLIYLAIPKIISIYETQDIYPPEGSMYKLCPKCPYHKLCLSTDPNELIQRVNKVPSKPYDPTNFR